jgi:hypothetical protein
MPKVHAIVLSSFGAVQTSNFSITHIITLSQTALNFSKLPIGGGFVPCRDLIPEKGSELKSDRATRIASSDEVNLSSSVRDSAMAKKNQSQPPRRQRYVKRSTFVSDERPLFIVPKATIPMTPIITIIVPYR